MATPKTRLRTLKRLVDAGLVLPPERVRRLVNALVEAEKIAVFEGVDAHTKFATALDAALKDP